jgi:hypothetical protein
MSHAFSVRVMDCFLFVRVNFSFILFFVQGHFMFCMSYCPIARDAAIPMEHTYSPCQTNCMVGFDR